MISQKIINQTIIGAGALVSVGLLSSSAQAATFDLTGFTDGADSTSIMADGINLTASNFNTGNGAGVDMDGLCIGDDKGSNFCSNGEPVEYSDFNLTFDQDVKLISYLPGFVGNEARSFMTKFSQGSESSTETDFRRLVGSDFSNQFTAKAGVPVNVMTILIDDEFPDNDLLGILQFSELTVEKVAPQNPGEKVPEPVTILGTLLAGGFGAVMKKRKGTNA